MEGESRDVAFESASGPVTFQAKAKRKPGAVRLVSFVVVARVSVCVAAWTLGHHATICTN